LLLLRCDLPPGRLRAQRLGLGDIRRIQFQFKTTKHDEIIQESMLPSA
jgi:hypothetical protein